MFTYLIYVIQDLIATGILVGLALSYARVVKGSFGIRVVTGGIVVALAASVVMAVLKQTTNMVDTGLWNMRIFVAAIVAMVVFLVLLIRPLAKSKVGPTVFVFALSVFVALRLFYKVPDVYLYPALMNQSVDTLISSDFVLRLTGYALGLAIVVLSAVALFKYLKSLTRRQVGLACVPVVVIIGIVQLMTCLQTMLARRIIPQNHELFEVLKFFQNNANLFTFIIMALALVLTVIVIARSLRDIDPYDNPAQHRKNKAKWRNRRRWAICFILCLAVSIVTLTVVKDMESRGPELSPSEECDIHDGKVYIPFEQVNDGHLHRFTVETEAGYETKTNSPNYATQGGVGVRFIVIQKPGGVSYGVGMDACDICGETGYYERDGQVVCRKCDVVMNISTIGFKGGCNPLVFDYEVVDGNIVIDLETLYEFEKVFKS